MDIRHLTATTREGVALSLTPLTQADIDRVYELCQDPDIQRWAFSSNHYPRESAETFICEHTPDAWRAIDAGAFSTAEEGSELVWGVRIGENVDEAALWGTVGLKRLGEGRVEIGWWLGAGARGHGVMRAAAAAVVGAAFREDFPIHAEEIFWYAYLGNKASALVANRIGFQYTGYSVDVARVAQLGPAWTAVIHPGDPVEPTDWPAVGIFASGPGSEPDGGSCCGSSGDCGSSCSDGCSGSCSCDSAEPAVIQPFSRGCCC
ncbi:MAG: GNAT family N-acetyltransferase [Propionibacteriaceae bacterium]|nr:GNAT family N-acetyltransferase [Propionibacteriaceae bacterium]